MMNKKWCIAFGIASVLAGGCAAGLASGNIAFIPSEIQCSKQTECPKGSACVRGSCSSFDHRNCRADSDCPDFEKCWNGQCVMCHANDDCTTGFSCNSLGVCIPEDTRLIACQTFAECDQGQTCINGTCVNFCMNLNHGGDSGSVAISRMLGMTECKAQSNVLLGIEVDDEPCTDDDDCRNHVAEQICYYGFCKYIVCHSDAECPEHRACDNGRCIQMECASDDECSHGKHCNNYRCVECTENTHCASGNCSNNVCLGCGSDEDCEGYDRCFEHKCVKCLTDDDCYGSKTCLNHQCVDCVEDSQCHAFAADEYGFANLTRCEANRCVECRSHEECTKTGICTEIGRCAQCRTDDDCEYGVCRDNGFCAQCRKNADCPDSHMACMDDGTCQSFECVDDSQCSSGQYCKKLRDCSDCPWSYECAEMQGPRCRSNADCSTGFRCNADGFCTNKLNMPGCESDSDCSSIADAVCGRHAAGMICGPRGCKTSANCQLSCRIDSDCLENQFCHLGLCEEGTNPSYCSTQKDCAENEVCNTFYGECVSMSNEQ